MTDPKYKIQVVPSALAPGKRTKLRAFELSKPQGLGYGAMLGAVRSIRGVREAVATAAEWNRLASMVPEPECSELKAKAKELGRTTATSTTNHLRRLVLEKRDSQLRGET